MPKVELHGFGDESACKMKNDIIERSARMPYRSNLEVLICKEEVDKKGPPSEQPFIKLMFTWDEQIRALLHLLRFFNAPVRQQLIGETSSKKAEAV